VLFGDVTLEQYVLVAVIGFAAAILGGVTGYGPGLLLPPVLLPIIGPEAVVPVVSAAGLLINISRVAAFRADFDLAKAKLIIAVALPTCVVGAYGYTLLSGPAVGFLLGSVLVCVVPLRRVLMRRRGHMQTPGLAAAGAGYGLLVGATSGVGVVLLAILLAAGMHGAGAVATDAGISVVLTIAKVIVFQTAGAMPLSSWVMAIVIGVVAAPGAFVAKRLTRNLSHGQHIALLDGVVVLGGVLLIGQSLQMLL
jgi:uncharacterized membrane protein YfcA